LSDGIEQLQALYASNVAAPAHVIAQEKRFAIECDSGVELIGRMDQINRVAPGEVEVIDYKTGKPKSETHAQKDLQLSIYALAAREMLDVTRAPLIYYNLQNHQCVSASPDEDHVQQVR